MKTIYLCGPINGRSDSECNDWRRSAKERLADRYRFLDPMRRDYRGKEDESVREIVIGDLADIMASDIVLALADAPSWGTAMEVRFAFAEKKPVVVVCGNDRVSPWLRYHATQLFRTLDEAVLFLMDEG